MDLLRKYTKLIKEHDFIIVLFIGVSLAYASTLVYGLWKDAHYHLNCLSFLFYILSLWLTTYDKFKHTHNTKLLIAFALFSSASNVFDEFFYDATKIEINDLIRLSTVILATLACKKSFKQ